MRNIRLIGLVQRLGYLNKNSTLLNKINPSNLNRTIENSNKLANIQKRYASSRGANTSSPDLNKTGFVYSLAGAGVMGVILAFTMGTLEEPKSDLVVPVGTIVEEVKQPVEAVVEEKSEESIPQQEPVAEEKTVSEEKAPEPVPEEKPVEPVAEEKAPEPIAEEKVPEPVPEEISVEPVTEEISVEPVAEEKAPGPIVEDKAPEPVAEEKAPEPIVEDKAPEPVVEEKAAEPIVEEKAPEPVAEEKPVEPVAEEKPVEPVAEEKAAEPVAEEKAPEPVSEEKAPEPVSEEKPVEPLAEEKAPEPVVEEKLAESDAVTNEQEVAEQPPVETVVASEKSSEPVEVVAEVAKQEEAAPVEAETEKPADQEVPAVVKAEQDKFLPDIPNHAQYLIVGGGTAAMAAFKAIRASDPTAKVLVVSEEEYKPYMRPPLSKDLWMTDDEKLVEQLRFKQYNGNERSIFFLEDEFYVEPKYLNEQENGGVAVLTGKQVTKIDAQNKLVKLNNDWEISYDKCLIATGGKPRTLKVFDKCAEKVTLFRNIEDFKKLYQLVKEGKTVAIVGGGFLGSELACALAHASKKYGGKVMQIFPESGNLHKVLPEYLSEWTTRKIVEEGVSVIPKARINRAQLNDSKVELSLESSDKSSLKSKWVLADHVVVAVGLEPNVQLANSGFEVDNKLGGYLVNAELQARNSIWVAGDAACFYDVKLGRRRVEHHDHAVVSGRLAGENMTGAAKPYWHQSMFWSDLGPKIGFEAIGLVDSSLQTVGLFAKADDTDTPQSFVNENNETLRSEVKDTNVNNAEAQHSELRRPFSDDEFGKGVVLYLKDDVLVGVLLWNVFKRIPIARQLIQSHEKITDFKEIAKLFKINASGLEQ